MEALFLRSVIELAQMSGPFSNDIARANISKTANKCHAALVALPEHIHQDDDTYFHRRVLLLSISENLANIQTQRSLNVQANINELLKYGKMVADELKNVDERAIGLRKTG